MENQDYHINSYNNGINYDTDVEKAFSENNGQYIDGHNCEPTSNSGNTGALNKIKGEIILYANTTNSVGYKCIGAISVNEYNVEFWAPANITFPGIVRINGTVVLSSVNFELRQDFPLQLDKNRSASFSEVVVNDRKVPPFIFNLKDMVDSLTAAPNKYFSAFDPELYQVNLQSALDIMVFDELINVGGGGGLPNGHYQYQMRYASKEGDVTRWSHPTPMIPVVESLSSDSNQYPWTRTYGGPPNPSSVTSFAPKMRFRVTNLYNYDYIEIKRIEYNAGAGIEYTSNGKVVARISIGAGEISVREYIDPSDSNENIVLSAEDEARQVTYIDKCNTVRYYDRRLVLMGYSVPSRDADLQFVQVNGQDGWPVINKLFKAGYKDPYNHVYKKSFMRGEQEGFGVALYDGVGNKGFTQKHPNLKDFQFPNRRDVIAPGSNTANFSVGGTVKAADTTTNAVSQTFEVFDHYDAVQKQDLCDFKNIISKGRVTGSTGTKMVAPYGVNQDCSETDGEIENHGANVSLNRVSVSYQPFTPVRQSDANVEGHDYIVNNKVGAAQQTFGPIVEENKNAFDYRPSGFSPDYYAMGMMIGGVTNFPKWAKSFAVVRTDVARRVLCQGLGWWSMKKAVFKALGNQSLGEKALNKFWFYAPDIENGIVSSDTINDIIDNPQNYKAQFVSPLGFFSEWYSAEDNLTAGQRDRCIDMISYARLLRDHATAKNLQINVNESSTMGIPGGDGFNYVCHDKWRNVNIQNFFQNSSGQGNHLVDISVVRRKAVGRGQYLEIELDQNVYGNGATGGNSNDSFNDVGCKNLHEPVHIINIIRTGATVRDNDVQKYKQTTHYQKLESIIGKSNGLTGQKFQLVDERYEDCIPSPFNGDFGSTVDRFIYIKLLDGTVEQWQNVTYKTPAQIATLTNNIVNNTGGVRGLYTHTNINNLSRQYEIDFNVGAFIPPTDSLIMVRYDSTAPIRVFGGDTYIGETIFAPIDSQANAQDKAAETQFAWGVGLPYRDFKINPRYYTIRKAGGINEIQDKEWFAIGFIRQLCVMFTVESRAAVHLAYNNEDPSNSPSQFFPLRNYIIRPNRWDPDKTVVDNHLYDDYGDDYNGEINIWKWGGFRFLQQINPDYSVEPPRAFFSKPEFGFTEILDYPSGIIQSLPRAINVQNSPGLKTFPANNAYYIEDNQGAIKFAWDDTTDQGGENLYAFCNTGICLLLTRKSILSDLNSGNIGYMAGDSFIGNHIWLNKEIGMFDEFWRGAAEAVVPITMENGSEVLKRALFFPSKESVYRFMEGQLVDIGRINYHARIYNDGLLNVLPGMQTDITGVFDRYKKQYYLSILVQDEGGVGSNITFVFSQKRNMWFGTNGFSFDRYTSTHNDMYGHRDMQTFKLNSGYIMNGSPVEMRVIAAAVPDPFWDKEFMRFRINSSVKPNVINFMKIIGGPVQCFIPEANLKNYRGFEQDISRIQASVDVNRPRLQGRVVVFEIIHNKDEEFRIIDTGVQYKKLKMQK